MAVKAITPEVLTLNTVDVDALAMTAATATTDGFMVDVSKAADQKLLFVFQNSSSTTAYDITFKAGDSFSALSDYKVEIAATKFAAAVVESGKYKITTGDNKGKIQILPEHADVKMAAVVLP